MKKQAKAANKISAAQKRHLSDAAYAERKKSLDESMAEWERQFRAHIVWYEKQPMKALLIRPAPLAMILDGRKTWEIRGSKTKIRGTIALIPSGSGTITGLCDLVDCIGPLSANQFRRNSAKAGMRRSEAELGRYKNTFAWVLDNPRPLKKPLPYKHPSGAIIWVKLDGTVAQSVWNER
jgi:hypothetical protein